MAENSKIEWTTHTMNFWIGCQEVSPACDFCYAKTQNEFRHWVDGWGPHGERRRTSAGNWHKLRKWNREAGECGVRDKVFSNSLADFFDKAAQPAWRREAWHYIEQSPNLDFLLLTKRPQNITGMLPDPETGVRPWGDGWPNVWLGTTIENRKEGERRAVELAKVPAVMRFWSCEPLLEDLGDLTGLCLHDTAVDGRPAVGWVITGGESGPKARPSHPDWFRSIRDQCAAAGVAYFHKQNGEWAPVYEFGVEKSEGGGKQGAIWENDGWTIFKTGSRHGDVFRIGLNRAGALLDSVSHGEMPR